MTQEYSYGIVPVYKDKKGNIEILVVKGAGYRGFPKGHVEEGEMPVETAIRELYEETGITLISVDETVMFKDHYVFTQKKRVISKYVGYFLGTTSDKKVVLQTSELSSCHWLSLPEARDLLTFDSEKKILDAVAEQILHFKG